MRLATRLVTSILLTGLATSSAIPPASAQGVSTFSSGLTFAAGLAFDSQGRLYVTRRSTVGVVQRCTPPGNTWTTVASGLGDPWDLAFDPAGNLYVTNYAVGSNGAVYKITPGGVKSTFATFIAPSAIAVGPDGNIYVGLYNAKTIQMITPGGVVTPYCDLGSYNFNAHPMRFWFEPDGTLYVGVEYGELVKVAPGGSSVTHVNRSMFGFGGLTKLPDGNFYATSYDYHEVWQIAPDGTGTRWSGAFNVAGHVDGLLTSARFNAPAGLASFGGLLYVAEYGNNDIRVFTDLPTSARNTTWGRIKALYR
jgi:streptogramin lyase